jgi:ribulose-5-phosphate 4-epimerase/fuculose-1-phosphate aldolase
MSLIKNEMCCGDSEHAKNEKEIREELAALYRLVALHGWDDAVFTHISARLPGNDHHFLINPYGLFFDEITASSLVKIDIEGKIVGESDYCVNPAGFTIHSAIHMARPDVRFVIHIHGTAGVAVASQRHGLLPLSQHALIVMPSLAYHDYEGIALNLDERERLIADLGDKTIMILRNHGTLAVGATAAEAWLQIYYLETACAQQIGALSAGHSDVLLAPEPAQAEVRRQVSSRRGKSAALAWPGFLRLLDRRSPGYRA